MFDPVDLARELERKVTRGVRRKYYRFRGARFYGGIATADCVGCCLRCLFCWGWKQVTNPGGSGRFYSPQQVADRLADIALERSFTQARLSGNEPTLARDHLLGVLAALPAHLSFILETNGILLGHDPTYAAALAAREDLHVRVSLKGCNAEEFSHLTGADARAFELPLRALEALLDAGVACHAAVMTTFSTRSSIESLRRHLAAIDPRLAELEEEEAFLNPAIEERLSEAGVRLHEQDR